MLSSLQVAYAGWRQNQNRTSIIPCQIHLFGAPAPVVSGARQAQVGANRGRFQFHFTLAFPGQLLVRQDVRSPLR